MDKLIQLKDKDRITIEQEQEKRNELKHIRRVIPHEGHTLFEINESTGEIEEAEFDIENNYHLIVGSGWKKKNAKVSRKLIVKQGCVYVSALNKKNAWKNYQRGKLGGKELIGFVDL